MPEKEESNYELINNKDDTCNACAFASSDCPDWAFDKCSNSNKVWVEKKSKDSEPFDLTPGQTVGVAIGGCLLSIIIAAVLIIANAFLTGWVLHKFFNM